MTNTEKEKTVKLGGLQAHTKELFNKGIGNEGICSTAADTTVKAVTLGTTFDLVAKATILVTFTNGISVANSTLAVTHTDLEGTKITEEAKPIYYRGAALPANLIKAEDKILMRYDGTSFNIIGVLSQDLSGLQAALESEESRARTKEDAIETVVNTINGPSTVEGSFRKAIADLIGGAPEAFDTLKEIADRLAEDDDLHKAIEAAIALKADRSATVAHVDYNSNTKKLSQTVDGVTTEICSVVNGGLASSFDSTTGIVYIVSVGETSVAPNADTGYIVMTF